MKDLQKLIKDNTVDDVTNWEAIEGVINKEINDIVAKNKPKDIVAELGYENLDALKEDLGKVNELEKLNKTLEEKEKVLNDVSGSKTELERKISLMSQGINDQDTLDYLMFNISKRVSEDMDWDKALASYKEEKPQYFEKKPITTAIKSNNESTPKTFGWEEILAERHPELKE